MIYDEKTLARIIAYLQLRFPVAELSRELGYTKGTVSNYLKGAKPISESFVTSLESKYNIKYAEFAIGTPASVTPHLSMRNIKEITIFIAENKYELMEDPFFNITIENMYLLSKKKRAEKRKK